MLKHLGLTRETVQREIHYTMNRIKLIKNNESSWNFLHGLLEYGDFNITQFPDVETFTEELYNSGNRSPYLLAFLVDLYIEKTLQIYEANSYDDPEVFARKVVELCEMLANHYDTIRYKYWKYIIQKFSNDKEKARIGPSSTESGEKSDETEPAEVNEEQNLNGNDQ